MARTFKCKCCRRTMPANPRCKSQEYCGASACQRERKRRWQAQKMNSDPEYRHNQREAYDDWCQRNPDYWRRRREAKQCQAALPGKKIQTNELNGPVKMDTFRSDFLQEILVNSREYLLVPINVKMDALKVKNIAIPAG
jgi:hypothetical protein